MLLRKLELDRWPTAQVSYSCISECYLCEDMFRIMPHLVCPIILNVRTELHLSLRVVEIQLWEGWGLISILYFSERVNPLKFQISLF